jgi:hypothetical protein
MFKPAKYGCGGKVVKSYADGGKAKKAFKKGSKKKEPTPDMLGTGMAAKAGDALRDTRKKQMKDLGLKNGGRIKR